MIAPNFSLEGRVAIVTGGNGGLGYAMAEALGGAGASLAIVGRDKEKGLQAVERLRANSLKASFFAADISTQEGSRGMRDRVVDEFGRIDVLVNNAGINIRKLPQEYSSDEWRLIQTVNVDSAYFCATAVYPDFMRAGGGKIVNIGSMMSIFGASWNVPYTASKGAIVQLTRGLAAAWGRDNIQCNAILPGWINTEMTASSRSRFPDLEESVRSRTPTGRWGEPPELGGAVVFLCSDASRFVTGVSIPVDGGYSIQG